MELTIMLLFIFAIGLLISDIRNLYHILFAVMLFSMAIVLTATLMFATKKANYVVNFGPFLSILAHQIYLLLLNILKYLPLSKLLLLRNVFVSIYFCTIILFVNIFCKNLLTGQEKSRKRPLMFFVYSILTIYIISFFIFYHSKTAWKFYILYHTAGSPEGKNLIRTVVISLDRIISYLGTICLVYPIAFLLYNGMKNRITFFFDQLLGLSISIGLLNSLFYFTIFISDLRLSASSLFNTGLWSIAPETRISRFYDREFPVIVFILLAIVTYFIIWTGIDSMFLQIRSRSIKKQLNTLYANLRDVFHSNKNLMFTFKMLSETALQNYGSPEGEAALRKINDLSSHQLTVLTNNLNNIRNLNAKTSFNDFTSILDKCLSETVFPPSITVEKDYSGEKLMGLFDSYQLEQLFSNIFHNSIDALMKKKENQNGMKIKISVVRSKNWIYCSVWDNGCGIAKKDLRKVFSLNFSTSIGSHNFGMGMPYVMKIVESHGGHIRIKSKEQQFTKVEILLPGCIAES
ncbi:MAG: ATP-binding protein [Clostridiaceae bacterium]|nr:ATP-binding protein [Clostridiaceae bacterium]